MRDGIPRALPVPRKWQVFVECADRASDRGTERVVARLCEAVCDDMHRDFPSAERESLKRDISSTQPSLPGLELRATLNKTAILNPGQSHHYSELIADARDAIAAGTSPRDAIVDAVVGRMEATTAARCRQICEDLAAKINPSEIKHFLSEFDRAAAAIDYRQEAVKFLDGSSIRNSPTRRSIEPDEDLRGAP